MKEKRRNLIRYYKIAKGNKTALIQSNSENINRVKILKKCEQFGFVNYGKIPKLEMMGGELCINASIAFAFLLKGEGKFKTSGLKELVKYENKINETTIIIPLKYTKKNNIILFEGIGYILLDKNKVIDKKLLEKYCKKYNLGAFGVVYYENDKIFPFIYVKKVNSFVKESACGSGSVAYSIFRGYSEIKQPSGGIIKVKIIKDKIYISAEVKNV